MLQYPPLSLYIHIPWCVRKCPYCDFNSHQSPANLPEQDYVAAVCEDIRSEQERRREDDTRVLQSVFIGGGTPSLFRAQFIDRLLATAEAAFGFRPDIEITLEANPSTVETRRFRGYRACGVNRLSLGIQSFVDDSLGYLGRAHNATEARQALKASRQAGFDNINLDLMHSLPGQSVNAALADIEQALSFGPTHLSWYQLTIEPNTEFYKKPPALPAEAVSEQIFLNGLHSLDEAGFIRYEVSAFCQSDHFSRHNLNYWSYGDYIGVGAGAHGKLSNPHADSITRYKKYRQPEHYMTATIHRDAERTEVPIHDRALEFLLNALRLRRGFTTDDFEERTGVAFSAIRLQVEYLAERKLLKLKDNHITTTERGYRMLDSLLEHFLDDEQPAVQSQNLGRYEDVRR